MVSIAQMFQSATLKKLQTRLFKTGIGIFKFCGSSTILKALNVPKIDNAIETRFLKMISAIFSNSSRAKIFYSYLLKKHWCDQLCAHTDLIAQSKKISNKHDKHYVAFFMYILDVMSRMFTVNKHQASTKTSNTAEDSLCHKCLVSRSTA